MYTFSQSSKGTTNGKATTVSAVLSGTVTAGDCLSLFVPLYQPTGFSLLVSDTASNEWFLDDSNLNSTEGGWLYRATANGTVAGLTVTAQAIKGGIPTAAYMTASLIDFTTDATPSLVGTSSAVDNTGVSKTLAAGNISFSGAVCLVICAGTSNTNIQTWTPGSGFTIAESYPGTSAVTLPMAHSYRIGVSSSINPGMSTSANGNWCCIGEVILDYRLAGIQSVTPQVIQSSNSTPFTLTITGYETNFTSGSVISIQNSITGTTDVIPGTWTVLSATSATLDVTTGVGVGTYTVTVDGYVSAVLSTSLQPFTINALITSNGILAFIFTTSTPTNGVYPYAALTAINSNPTIKVDGSSVGLGPATGTLSTPDAALVAYRPATPIAAGQVVTYSLAASGFATALGTSLTIQNASVSNQVNPTATFAVESLEYGFGTWQGFQVPPTMLAGVNAGSEPSSPTTTWFPAANALLGSGYQNNNSWRYLGSAVPGGYDANGYPISWPAGGTITTQLQTGGPPDGVTGAALPVQMGTWTVLYNDPANDKTFVFTGNANVTISTPVKTFPDGRTQITSQVNYVASPASLGPTLDLAMTSVSGLYKPGGVDPDIWVLTPGDAGRTDQSNPFAPSALFVSRLKTASGNAIKSIRTMDWSGFANFNGYALATDLLNLNAATWFTRQSVTAPGIWTIQLWDTDGAGTPNVYGPQTAYFAAGPDSFGYYCPLSASDGGTVALIPGGNNQQWCVFQLTCKDANGNPLAHGFVHGRPFASATGSSLSGAAISGSTVTYTGTIHGGDNNAFVGATATVSGFANGGNNGTFTITGSSATTLAVTNASGVNETHAGSVVIKVTIKLTQSQSLTIGSGFFGGATAWVCDPYTIGVAQFCGGTAPHNNNVLTIDPANPGPYAGDSILSQTFPVNNASVPYPMHPALCSSLGPETAVYINLPGFDAPGCHAAIAQQTAPYLAAGATVYLEFGNEVWNPADPPNPNHNEMGSAAWMVQYYLVGTVLFGGHYVVTTVNVGQPLPNWETAYVLTSAAAMDAFTAALGRPDVTVRCLIGSNWGSPTTTSPICAAIATPSYGLSSYFYGLVVAPYMSISNDVTIQNAFNPSIGSWPAGQLNDLNRFYLATSTIEQGFFSGHAAVIAQYVPDMKLIAYEYAENYPVPSGLSGSYYNGLAHDLMAHPSAYQLHWCFNLTLQQGCLGVPDSGFILAHYFSIFYSPAIAGSGGHGQYFLAAGLTQPPGYGLSNQFATAQGGSPADGKAHYLMNQAVPLQALHDWIDETTITYTIYGPTVVYAGYNAMFVILPNSFVASDTITFSDGGSGGVFTPSSLTFSNSSAPQDFVYYQSTPGTYTMTMSSADEHQIVGSPWILTVTSPGPSTTSLFVNRRSIKKGSIR